MFKKKPDLSRNDPIFPPMGTHEQESKNLQMELRAFESGRSPQEQQQLEKEHAEYQAAIVGGQDEALKLLSAGTALAVGAFVVGSVINKIRGAIT